MVEFFQFIVFPVVAIAVALKVLEELFKALIKAFKFVGALIVAFIPAAGLAYLSNLIFDMSTFEVGAQFIGTGGMTAVVAYSMFSNVSKASDAANGKSSAASSGLDVHS